MATRSKQVYEAMLNNSQFIYLGRRLKIKPHLRGVELYKENSRNNKRRMFLKRVPTFISEAEIKYYLETNFGRISEFYELMSDQSMSKPKYRNRKVKTYSIMFESSLSGKFNGCIHLEIRNGVYIQAERFSVKKKEATKPSGPYAGICQPCSIDKFIKADKTCATLSAIVPREKETLIAHYPIKVSKNLRSSRHIILKVSTRKRAHSTPSPKPQTPSHQTQP